MVGNGLGEDDLEGRVKRVEKSWGGKVGLVRGKIGLKIGAFLRVFIFQLVSKKTTQ